MKADPELKKINARMHCVVAHDTNLQGLCLIVVNTMLHSFEWRDVTKNQICFTHKFR